MLKHLNSKCYIVFVILIIVCFYCSTASAQERIAYRVEVVVFRLLDSQFPPEAVPEPRDFTEALDLVDRQLRIEQWDAQWPRMTEAQIAELAVSPPLTIRASNFPEIEGISLIPDRSEQMSNVWRNLRLSAEYRPEAYLSWQQAAEGDFPHLRIHNDEVILVEDSYADQRVAPPLTEDENPPWKQQIFFYDLEKGQFSLEPIPEPEYHYSLEGQIRLRRSRFLHVDLDISYRLPAPSTLQGLSGPPLQVRYQGYQTFTNVQSRQVRTNRLEYFDAPVLGVLVWITPIERSDETDAR